jgi:hypothetical protein
LDLLTGNSQELKHWADIGPMFCVYWVVAKFAPFNARQLFKTYLSAVKKREDDAIKSKKKVPRSKEPKSKDEIIDSLDPAIFKQVLQKL